MELLYWIPFLNWLTTEGGVRPERIVAVSRGGADPWYSELSHRYIDLLDHFGGRRLARWNAERRRDPAGVARRANRNDRRAFQLARETIGGGRAEWLHPSMITRLYAPRWLWGASESVVVSHATYRPLPSSPLGPSDLPQPYVAARLHFGPYLPNTPQNRTALSTLITRLAEQATVVVLGEPPGLDEHDSLLPPRGPSIRTVSSTIRPRTSLAAQTEIVRNASLLVSTYGGFAYLGPFVETPTVALYSNATFSLAHLDAIDRAGLRLGNGSRLFRARHVGSLRAPVEAAALQAEDREELLGSLS